MFSKDFFQNKLNGKPDLYSFKLVAHWHILKHFLEKVTNQTKSENGLEDTKSIKYRT